MKALLFLTLCLLAGCSGPATDYRFAPPPQLDEQADSVFFVSPSTTDTLEIHLADSSVSVSNSLSYWSDLNSSQENAAYFEWKPAIWDTVNIADKQLFLDSMQEWINKERSTILKQQRTASPKPIRQL